MRYKDFESIFNDNERVDLKELNKGDIVELVNGAKYVVGDIIRGAVEDQYGGTEETYLLKVGEGRPYPWGYENHSETIGGGRYSRHGVNERCGTCGSGITILSIKKESKQTKESE